MNKKIVSASFIQKPENAVVIFIFIFSFFFFCFAAKYVNSFLMPTAEEKK